MSNQASEITDAEWEQIIPSLQSFTLSLVKGKGWFRGEEPIAYLEGKEVDDYVFEAIGRYLQNPEKFNPARGTLINYLKFNLIRSLVSNDLVSEENITSSDVFAIEFVDRDDDDQTNYLDAILPHAEAFFDQEIDYNEVMSFIESEAKGDTIVENIFLGITGYGLKRSEIIKEFGMTSDEFDNGMRRLITIRKRAAEKFDIRKQAL